ncbi:MAG: P63C domain-containing protein [Patescibacteria group bacterium]
MSNKEEKITEAPYSGEIKIGGITIACAVLEDGTRIITQYDFYKAIGRSGKPAKGRGSAIEKVAPFLALNNLKPYVDKDLEDSTKPVKFKMPKGGIAWGYKAEILPKVCEVYLKARDDDALLASQEKFAVACDIIMRGLAHVGIIALVDEATGYQYARAREALEQILEQFIAKELFKWVKTFPDEFYQQLFRLRGWQYSQGSVKRPSVIGKLTNNLIYERLAPGVLDELKQLNPKTPKGTRRHHHHRWLTRDFGHPRLLEHLWAVVNLMRASANWSEFQRLINRALPKYGDLPLIEDAERRAKERDKAAL